MQMKLLVATFVGLLAADSLGSSLDAAVTRPAGVADVAWGSSTETAKKAMLARPEVVLVSETKSRLVFSGGTFAEHPAETWELLFTGGRFSEGFIRLKATDAQRQYEDLCQRITTKYRRAGREEREGAEHRATYWEYSQTSGKWGIVCDVRIPKSLTIRYKDKSPAIVPAKGFGKDL